MLKGTFC